MYFWNRYPFIRFSIALILGIVVSEYDLAYWKQPFVTLLTLSIFLILTSVLSYKIGFYKLRHFNGFMALITIFFLGGSIKKTMYVERSETHYTHYQRVSFFEGQVAKPPSERTNYYRYELTLKQAERTDSVFALSGTIHLYVRKDSTNTVFNYGDKLYVKGTYFPVPEPQNPHEFDYRTYLSRKNIYSQAFVDAKDVKHVGYSITNPVLHFAFEARSKAIQSIDRNITSKKENAIAKALLLGVKDYLDNDLKKSYSSAGAMHVLAVSGLHVGIIYLILQFLFSGLRKTLKGKKIFGVISILVIWIYALITGLSPSVLRAATMFSVMAVSQMRAKEGNIYNTLGFAAFVLLLYDPNLIYSVGFQLSFAAVFGIVYLQPKLYHLLKFNNWLADKAWSITCVSLAAQLSTFPLSAYYFHQFPTYFLVSNLIVIPAAMIMLSLGVAMLFFDFLFPLVGHFFGQLLSAIIWVVNQAVFWVEQLPISLIEWIHLDKFELLLVYGIILTMITGLHFKSFKTLILCSALFVTLSSWRVNVHLNQAEKEELVFYEVKGQTAIDYIDGHQATLFVEDHNDNITELLSFQINPNRRSSLLQPIQKTTSGFHSFIDLSDALRVGVVGTKRILIVDSTTFHLDFLSPITCDILLIENESVKSLKWLQDHFEFEELIIGNKNSRSYSTKMKKQAEDLAIEIHALKEDGALILTMNP